MLKSISAFLRGDTREMSQKDELIRRLKSKPKDFEIRELDRLMSLCNCEKSNSGKTSGSAIKYYHMPDKRVFVCHSPHPQKTLKRYVIDNVIAFLEEEKEI